MKKENRVCLISTQYSLLLYMLYSSLEDIKDTFFIFSYGTSKDIASRFPKSIFIEREKYLFGKKVKQWLYCFYLRKFKLRFVGHETKIFAQDHLLVSPSLLYNKEYVLLEDSPFISTIYRNCKKYATHQEFRSRKLYKVFRWLYGKTILSAFGNNDLCKGIIMSENEGYLDFLEGKERIICNLQDAWNKSTKEKKEFILSVFSITKEDIDDLRKYKYILFTQPLYPDCLDMEEHEQVFAKIIANYPKEKLIIKKHPRDECDYSKLSPNVKLFDKDIPSQLLDLLGIKFELAITPFSSAVFNISYPIQIDWYGTECHPKLLNRLGPSNPPMDVNKCYA